MRSAGGQQFSVLGKGAAACGMQASFFLTGEGVPKAQLAVSGGGGQGAFIRGKCDAANAGIGTIEQEVRGTPAFDGRGHAPDTQNPVPAAGGQQFAIGGKSQRDDTAQMFLR